MSFSNQTLGILTFFILGIILAYLVISLAPTCNGNYEFSLRELKFVCTNQLPGPIPSPPAKPAAPEKPVVPTKPSMEDQCDVPWQQQPLSCPD